MGVALLFSLSSFALGGGGGGGGGDGGGVENIPMPPLCCLAHRPARRDGHRALSCLDFKTRRTDDDSLNCIKSASSYYDYHILHAPTIPVAGNYRVAKRNATRKREGN